MAYIGVDTLLNELHIAGEKEGTKADDMAKRGIDDACIKYNHGQYCYINAQEIVKTIPAADVVEVKQIEIIRDDLKWWLETNSEKGVVYIPKYVVENMIAKMDGKPQKEV